jgi:hypothetical protein
MKPYNVQMEPEVACPICRASTGEKEVMDNYFVTNGDDGSPTGDEAISSGDDGNGQQFCNSCEENASASAKCADCDEYLCAACVRAHLRVKITKDHVITQLKASKRTAQDYNKCSIHRGEKLR